jgi:hypothetical protein
MDVKEAVFNHGEARIVTTFQLHGKSVDRFSEQLLGIQKPLRLSWRVFLSMYSQQHYETQLQLQQVEKLFIFESFYQLEKQQHPTASLLLPDMGNLTPCPAALLLDLFLQCNQSTQRNRDANKMLRRAGLLRPRQINKIRMQTWLGKQNEPSEQQVRKTVKSRDSSSSNNVKAAQSNDNEVNESSLTMRGCPRCSKSTDLSHGRCEEWLARTASFSRQIWCRPGGLLDTLFTSA